MRSKTAFNLSGLLDVERQDQARLNLLGERTNIALGLLVRVGDRQFGAEGAQLRRAAKGDAMFVGDADDETRVCRAACLRCGFPGSQTLGSGSVG